MAYVETNHIDHNKTRYDCDLVIIGNTSFHGDDNTVVSPVKLNFTSVSTVDIAPLPLRNNGNPLKLSLPFGKLM